MRPVLTLIGCLGLLFMTRQAAAQVSSQPAGVGVADPAFLELVSLRESRDATHGIAVKGPDGKTWYREEAAGANLRHLKLHETYTFPAADGEQYTVMVWVKRSYEGKLRQWCQERIGKPVGIVVDGKLHAADTLRSMLGNFFAVWPFETLDEALRVCAGIRVGGDRGRIDAELKELKRGYEQAQAELKVLQEQKAKEGPPPDAMEIVSLRQTRGVKHTQPIHGPDGKWWYRDPVAGLDLSHCETFSLGGTENAAYGYRAVVKDGYVDDFARWCEQRKGEYFGLVSDGYLMFVERMPGRLVDKLNRLTLVLEPMQPLSDEGPGTEAASASAGDRPRVEVTMQREYVKAITLDPAYLQIVALRSTADAIHTQQLKDASGKQWYRSETPGLDLRHCDFADADVSGSLGGKYRLCVRVREDACKDFAAWCKKHAGDHGGIIVAGQLIRVERIGGYPPHLIEIATYTSWEEAIKQRDALRKGGTD